MRLWRLLAVAPRRRDGGVYGTGTDGDRRGHGKQARISGVSSGSGVGEESGAWCGVQGTKKAETPRGQLGRGGEGRERRSERAAPAAWSVFTPPAAVAVTAPAG